MIPVQLNAFTGYMNYIQSAIQVVQIVFKQLMNTVLNVLIQQKF